MRLVQIHFSKLDTKYYKVYYYIHLFQKMPTIFSTHFHIILGVCADTYSNLITKKNIENTCSTMMIVYCIKYTATWQAGTEYKYECESS